MVQLHCLAEEFDLPRHHQPGARHQILDQVIGIEKGRGHLGTAVAQCHPQVHPLPLTRLAPHRFGHRVGDDVDEGDVVALGELEFLTLSADRHAVAVLTREMT